MSPGKEKIAMPRFRHGIRVEGEKKKHRLVKHSPKWVVLVFSWPGQFEHKSYEPWGRGDWLVEIRARNLKLLDETSDK